KKIAALNLRNQHAHCRCSYSTTFPPSRRTSSTTQPLPAATPSNFTASSTSSVLQQDCAGLIKAEFLNLNLDSELAETLSPPRDQTIEVVGVEVTSLESRGYCFFFIFLIFFHFPVRNIHI
ncbi:hypothetical protein LINPERPRIM_LOCUS25192, partial [Linum perenne]